MYVVVVFFEAAPGHTAALRDALMVQARTSLEEEPRCRRFDVSQDPVDRTSFLLYEIYDDEAAFKAHLETTHYAEFSVLVEPWTKSKRVLTYELVSDAGRA
jgi:autoinducer 2-degrading protein